MPNMSYTSRSWKSAVGNSSTQESISGSSPSAGVVEQRLHVQALDALHVEQLVVDAEARRGRQVVAAVQAGEEVVAWFGVSRSQASASSTRSGSTISVAMPR